MVTFGIEEEYLLLDPATGLPRFSSNEVRGFLEVSARIAARDIQSELLTCQLETSTPPCHTPAEALASLLAFSAANWPRPPRRPASGRPASELRPEWKQPRPRSRTSAATIS